MAQYRSNTRPPAFEALQFTGTEADAEALGIWIAAHQGDMMATVQQDGRLHVLDGKGDVQGIAEPLDYLLVLEPNGLDVVSRDVFEDIYQLATGDLVDMAMIGESVMAAIDVITKAEGSPYQDWSPADDPAEIVLDLYNDLEEARALAKMPAAFHNEPSPRATPLEPNDVDAQSFATTTAQTAASQVYGLLTTDNQVPVDNWFGSRFGDLVADVETLAHFVCAEGVDNPETLWRHGMGEGLIIREADTFAGLTFARRQAFEIFARVCSQTFKAVASVQKAIADETARQAAAASQAPLKREDSIMEEGPGPGDLVEHAAEFLERQQQPFGGRGDHDGDGKPGGAKQPVEPTQQPLSIGDTPPKLPANRGGRGKRKST